jgi:hypothetical protein
VSHTAFRRRAVLTATATAALLAAAAMPALADAASGSGCPERATSQPFAAWGDTADYFGVPGGDFETGADGWTLQRDAATVAGNQTSSVGPAGGSTSLSLPNGSTATSAPLCIGVEHRSMRFFAKGDGDPGGYLHVDALVDVAGIRRHVRLGRVEAGTEWSPSDVLPMVVNELAPEFGNAIDVSLRFSARGGNWSIDDVYVDPYRTG